MELTFFYKSYLRVPRVLPLCFFLFGNCHLQIFPRTLFKSQISQKSTFNTYNPSTHIVRRTLKIHSVYFEKTIWPKTIKEDAPRQINRELIASLLLNYFFNYSKQTASVWVSSSVTTMNSMAIEFSQGRSFACCVGCRSITGLPESVIHSNIL